MSQICHRYVPDISKIFLRYGPAMSQIYPRYVPDMSQISLRYVAGMSYVCPIYVPNISHKCNRYVPYMSEIFSRYIPYESKTCSWSDPNMSLICSKYVTKMSQIYPRCAQWHHPSSSLFINCQSISNCFPIPRKRWTSPSVTDKQLTNNYPNIEPIQISSIFCQTERNSKSGIRQYIYGTSQPGGKVIFDVMTNGSMQCNGLHGLYMCKVKHMKMHTHWIIEGNPLRILWSLVGNS